MKNSFLLVAFLCAVFLVSCKNTSAAKKYKLQGEALGTTYGITYISSSERLKSKAIDSLLQAVNQSMSTYWPNSDISKINKGNISIKVEPMFQEVFNLSKEVFKATNGYFDPTVGSLVNAWGFGPGNAIEMNAKAVDSLMQYVGFNKVSIENGFVKKDFPAIYFDFNAIAKGYTIDRIALVLDRLDIDNYLIEVGGELVAKGQNTLTKKKWLVGIDHPKNENRESPIVLIQLENSALASSGNYRKFRIDPLSGEKFVHTINPLIGYTENSSTLAASVLAPNCALADAYATAFMAMGYEKAIAFLETHKELEAFLVYLDPASGALKQYMSPGFSSLVYVTETIE